MKIASFDPLRPPPEKAKLVAALPYDVMNTKEARQMAEGNSDCFLHVSRPEIDLPDDVDPHDDAVYKKGAENLAALQKRGALIRHGKRGVFVYRQKMGDQTQCGVVCCCSVEEYDKDLIKKHERTRRDKEDDRTKHALAIRAHAGPVFLTYKDRSEITNLMNEVMATAPLYDLVADDRIVHTVWEAPKPDAFIEAFAQVPVAYVADGHHRIACASRAAAEMRKQGTTQTGDEEWNWFMAALLPASQLRILAYNRAVADLNGLTREQFVEACRGRFEVSSVAAPVPSEPGRISVYLDSDWIALKATLTDEEKADPIRSLDVSILQDRVLGPILNVVDPRTSDRIEFIGGIRGTQELERRVDTGAAAIAFSLYPTTIQQLMAVADAGLIMPPKSTWFEPKLRSGLLVHTF